MGIITMLNFNELMEAVEQLTDEQIRALKQRLEELESVTQKSESHLKPRTPNLHPGSVWMSDDFDDPLPDEFWFGDDE
jgi:hypothetical protein